MAAFVLSAAPAFGEGTGQVPRGLPSAAKQPTAKQPSAPQPPAPRQVDLDPEESIRISLRTTADKINVATGGIVDLFLVDPTTLSIRGLKPGTTSLVIDYDDGPIEMVNVNVSAPRARSAAELAAKLQQSLASIQGIQVRPQDGKVLISGTTDPRNETYYREVTALFANQIVDQVRFSGAPRTSAAVGPQGEQVFTNVGTPKGKIERVPDMPPAAPWAPETGPTADDEPE